MTTNKSNISLSGELPIVSLLQALGHKPVSDKGDESLYAGVFGKRSNNKIVLKVNHQLNSWFDSSLNKGGNLMVELLPLMRDRFKKYN